MVRFIELHIASTGSAVLINIDWIEEIRESENGKTTVYFAFTGPNYTEQDYIYPAESYEEICARLRKMGVLV